MGWRVDPDHLRPPPTASGSCPSPWMEFPGQIINPTTVLADFLSLTVVTLMGCHKFDTAVAMPVVVLVHKIYNPQAALLLAGEWLARIIRPVFNGEELRL